MQRDLNFRAFASTENPQVYGFLLLIGFWQIGTLMPIPNHVIEPPGNSLVTQTTAGVQDVMAALLSIHNV